MLMPMDSHVLEADFIGVIEVVSMETTDDPTVPQWRVGAEIVETWASRWEAGRVKLDFPIRAGSIPLVEGERYVVLMSGGPHRESPFTHRDNSVFPILDSGRVNCASGIPLFAVSTAGFMCSAQPLVVGEPLTVEQMHTQLTRARTRAAARQPERMRALDAAARPLIEALDETAEVSR
jgi:hypothetical protein